MSTRTPPVVPPVLSDRHLWAAVFAGPVCWATFYWVTAPPVRATWPLQHPVAFLLPVLVYPVLEEIVFRGLLQGWLHEHLVSLRWRWISPANLVTSAVFSAAHLINHPPLWAAAVFLPSLVFGYFRDRRGGLGAPIGLHIFYNAGFVWLFSPPGT